MKPAAFEYHDPRSTAEVLALLVGKENSRVLAGGQSLVPMLNFRLATPGHVIDLNRIDALRGITRRNGVFVLGAMTRQCEIEFSGELHAALPLLREAVMHVGHHQTRNRGTLGGSLCHLDPSAELVTAAAALDATLNAESSKGARRIAIANWGHGYLTSDLADDEILTSVELPVWPAGHGYAFVEFARRHGDFAIVAVAALMTLNAQGAIDRVAIAIGGCEANPLRLAEAEAALKGNKPSAALFKSTARLASTIDAMSDPYVKADYRKHLARVLTERALDAAAQRARTGGSQ
jgi:aerobic carbon-monoxide dehydrogenase medium subunit